jgi:UPF0042 nucleotide-binding protein
MIEIASFGRKHGSWEGSSTLYDCTGLDNPHREPELREKDGRDPDVQMYVKRSKLFPFLVTDAFNAAKAGAKVVFCCVGGRHRSVACAEHVAKLLRGAGHEVSVFHRELDRS